MTARLSDNSNTAPADLPTIIEEGDVGGMPKICHGLTDGISILTADLEIVDVNYPMAKWYSDRECIVGKKCFQVYHNRTNPCEKCPAMKTLQRHGRERAVVVHETVKAERVGVQDLQTFPVFDDNGKVAYIVEYVRDVTTLRNRSYELAQARREISRLKVQNSILQDALYRSDNLSHVIRQELLYQLDWVVGPLLDELRSRAAATDSELIDEISRSLYEPVAALGRLSEGDLEGHQESDLTLREIEVLRLTQKGLTSKEIADQLSVSPRTVDYHRQKVRKKLNLCGDSRRLSTQLAQVGIR